MAGLVAPALNHPGAAAAPQPDPAQLLHELVAATGPAALEELSKFLAGRWRTQLGTVGLTRRLSWPTIDTGSSQPQAPWRVLLAAALSNPNAPLLPEEAALADTVAFGAVLAGFIAPAWAELADHAGTALGLLAGPAKAALKAGLFNLLAFVALPVLNSEFGLHQALAGQPDWLTSENSRSGYTAFVGVMRGGGLAALVREYPALARLLATAAIDWAAAHARMLRRLEVDWPGLCARFGIPDATCRLEALTSPCSDRHDMGQSVAILLLPSGRRLVYKPRPLDLEARFGALLDWANQHRLPWPFRVPIVWPRAGYGWMEYIAPAECPDMQAVGRFYARSGALFCLCWLLQATDIHHENIIAAGEQPVLVDAETLLHPRIFAAVANGLGPGARHAEAPAEDFARALAESGFLPVGSMVECPAWGSVTVTPTPFLVARCAAVNSDAMTLDYAPFQIPAQANLPVLGGRQQGPVAHRAALVAGFQTMGDLLLSERAGLARLLAGFDGCEGRFVARATNAYGLLLHASVQPDWLREGPARGVLFDRLRIAAVAEPYPPACWPLLDRELVALERLDIPRFGHRCEVAPACWNAPLAEAQARLAGLSAPLLQRNAETLSAVLARLSRAPSPPDVNRGDAE